VKNFSFLFSFSTVDIKQLILNMSKLNNDIIFLILKEFSNDLNLLNSCLLVNKTWCEIAVPILWNDPFCRTVRAKKRLLRVILLHLSEESREYLKTQEIDLFVEIHQQPLFNYINFWRHLNLRNLEDIINHIENVEMSKISIVMNETMKLFINRNTKFTSSRS
jgi:hypothetical protein